MNISILARVSFCIFFFCMHLYKYIDKSNKLTGIKMELPKIEKKVFEIKEKNKKLQYEISRFESPNNLMKLVRSCEFSHLKHPLVKDVLKLEKGIALKNKTLSNFLNE